MNDKICGHDWEAIQRAQQGGQLHDAVKFGSGDYGCDPMGDGMFKMVPSGDIVNADERARRLR